LHITFTKAVDVTGLLYVCPVQKHILFYAFFYKFLVLIYPVLVEVRRIPQTKSLEKTVL
jgi:hypothetical protein